MKRTPMKRSKPMRQRRREGADIEREMKPRAERIAAQKPPPALHTASMGKAKTKPAPPSLQKIPGKVRQAIRDSARGEECTVRILGVCNHDPATTVWSHYPENDAGKGMGTKSLDLAGAYSCSACHDVVDRRVPMPSYLSPNHVMLAWHVGHLRSLVRLAQKGLL